jgi:hypothetical protein
MLLASDILGVGELRHDAKRHMLLGAAGERPLGIQAAQLIAIGAWARKNLSGVKISLYAGGILCSVAALVAAAIKPALFKDLVTDGLPDTLTRLLEWPVEFDDAPTLFCFGLQERFDIDGLVECARPVRVRDLCRGPI